MAKAVRKTAREMRAENTERARAHIARMKEAGKVERRIFISSDLVDRAAGMVNDRGLGGFSALVEQLITEAM